jgi:hypothetical protein
MCMTGVEQVFCFLTPHVFFHVDCRRPEWVMVSGRCLQYNMCVGVSVGGLACDCGPEIADAAFPIEVYLPIKEGVCACSVFLKSS